MLKALLLGDGALCRWDHLEAIVGDRLTAFDREPIVSVSQAVLGALERGKLGSEFVDAAYIDPLLV